MKRYLAGTVVLLLGFLLGGTGLYNELHSVEGTMGWYSVLLGTFGIIYGTLTIIAQKRHWAWWL